METVFIIFSPPGIIILYSLAKIKYFGEVFQTVHKSLGNVRHKVFWTKLFYCADNVTEDIQGMQMPFFDIVNIRM